MPPPGRIASGLKSMAQWKKFFFTADAVTKRLEKAKLTALRRFGGYLAKTAKRSMRYRKGPSAPGQPPSAHKNKRRAALKKMGRAMNNGALLRELLFFAYDPTTDTVVVGPQGFAAKGSNVPTPQLHEEGGERTGQKGDVLEVKNPAGRDERGRFFSRGVHLIRMEGKRLRFPARPYMAPALKKTRAKFAEMFRSTLTR